MNSAPIQRKVLVANPHGLHMRPSAAIAQLAERFQSSITVTHDANGKTVNGKSVWDLLTLEALPGCELTLEADGPDARDALEALVALIASVPVEN